MRSVSRRFRPVAWIIFLSMAVQSHAQEMTPIDKFIGENANSKNVGIEVFVGLRCSSLFTVLRVYLENNKMLEASKKFEAGSHSALKFAIENAPKNSEKYLTEQLKFITSAYTEIFLK